MCFQPLKCLQHSLFIVICEHIIQNHWHLFFAQQFSDRHTQCQIDLFYCSPAYLFNLHQFFVCHKRYVKFFICDELCIFSPGDLTDDRRSLLIQISFQISAHCSWQLLQMLCCHLNCLAFHFVFSGLFIDLIQFCQLLSKIIILNCFFFQFFCNMGLFPP